MDTDPAGVDKGVGVGVEVGFSGSTAVVVVLRAAVVVICEGVVVGFSTAGVEFGGAGAAAGGAGLGLSTAGVLLVVISKAAGSGFPGTSTHSPSWISAPGSVHTQAVASSGSHLLPLAIFAHFLSHLTNEADTHLSPEIFRYESLQMQNPSPRSISQMAPWIFEPQSWSHMASSRRSTH